eukprot:UN06536
MITKQIDGLLNFIDDSTKNAKSSKNKKQVRYQSTKKEEKQTTTDVKKSSEDDNEPTELEQGLKMLLKTPKGTRDYKPEDMVIRRQMMKTLREEFRRMGCAELETPVFEIKDILMGQYGEDEKLIYELADQGGGEKLALRYDLTVPLARYVAQNRRLYKTTLRAARIGRVYRRDTPKMTKGRLREFYQCDLDIVRFGLPSKLKDLVIDDCEVVNMVCSVLSKLLPSKKDFLVRVNNRKIFDCILSMVEVSDSKFRTIGSAVDKMDKLPWEDVKAEMIQKGLNEKQAESIKKYISMKGSVEEICGRLKSDKDLCSVKGATEAVEELTILSNLITAYGWQDNLEFDMSMVRGLNYYTGIILEANLTDPEEASEIGSIAAGGRYNELVNVYCDGDFPCTGASIGFERIFSYLKLKQKQRNTLISQTCTQVLVCEVGPKDREDLLVERMKMVNTLRNAGVSAELL